MSDSLTPSPASLFTYCAADSIVPAIWFYSTYSPLLTFFIAAPNMPPIFSPTFLDNLVVKSAPAARTSVALF